MFSFACPLQPFQLVDGLKELAVIGSVVAQDAVQLFVGRQAERSKAPGEQPLVVSLGVCANQEICKIRVGDESCCLR